MFHVLVLIWRKPEKIPQLTSKYLPFPFQELLGTNEKLKTLLNKIYFNEFLIGWKNFIFSCWFAITSVLWHFYYLLQNPLLDGGDLSTMIATDPSSMTYDEFGKPMYKNRRTVRLLINSLYTFVDFNISLGEFHILKYPYRIFWSARNCFL